jgi:hypothetical protein
VSPVPSAVACAAVEHPAERLRRSGASMVTPPEPVAAANDSAWDAGLMLSQGDVWMAVYQWGGFSYDDPPPDDTTMSLGGNA